MSDNQDLLNLLNEAIKKKLLSIKDKDNLISSINAGVEKKSEYINHMESTSDQLKKPMSFAKKTLLSAGGLAVLSGLVKPGTLAKNLMVNRAHVTALKNAKEKIVNHYDDLISAVQASAKAKDKALDKAWILRNKRKLWNETEHGIKQIKLQSDTVQDIIRAENDISKNRDKLIAELPWATRNLDKLDVILPTLGAMSVAGTLMTKKAEKELPFQATKESQELPKVLIRPDLVKEPTYYTRGFQSGPIIENANKMDKIASLEKIAEAVNSLFPKVPTDPRDIQLEQQEKVLSKQEKGIIKRDEMLAQHEQAHEEKDMKLKELQKAIKQVNGQAQAYRAKAIEHFTNSLDAEVAGTPGR